MDEASAEHCKTKPFDSAAPPYGSRGYDENILDSEQQEKLNHKKLIQKHENEAYLHDHPEIKGLVSMLLRHLLIERPTGPEEVQDLTIAFFGRPRKEIASELLNHLLETDHEGVLVEDLKKEIDADATE